MFISKVIVKVFRHRKVDGEVVINVKIVKIRYKYHVIQFYKEKEVTNHSKTLDACTIRTEETSDISTHIPKVEVLTTPHLPNCNNLFNLVLLVWLKLNLSLFLVQQLELISIHLLIFF